MDQKVNIGYLDAEKIVDRILSYLYNSNILNEEKYNYNDLEEKLIEIVMKNKQ